MSDLKIGGVDLGDVAKAAAMDAVKGTVDDAEEIGLETLQEFADQIGNDMLEASILGRGDLIDELSEQSVMLAEEKRIKLSEAGKDRLKFALKVVGKVVLKVAMASLGMPPVA
jgi:hypothetical protein